LEEYRSIHRLDKLTSGVLILAKTKELSNKYAEIIQNRDCKKVYFARVEGDFDAKSSKGVTDAKDGEVVITDWIYCTSKKLSKW
jgi:23S rRNA-/tRNA-specific pseudouridylate synthase